MNDHAFYNYNKHTVLMKLKNKNKKLNSSTFRKQTFLTEVKKSNYKSKSQQAKVMVFNVLGYLTYSTFLLKDNVL